VPSRPLSRLPTYSLDCLSASAGLHIFGGKVWAAVLRVAVGAVAVANGGHISRQPRQPLRSLRAHYG
jgi:hypothetical protein